MKPQMMPSIQLGSKPSKGLIDMGFNKSRLLIPKVAKDLLSETETIFLANKSRLLRNLFSAPIYIVFKKNFIDCSSRGAAITPYAISL